MGVLFLPMMFICIAIFLLGFIILMVGLNKQDKIEREPILKQAKIMMIVSGLIFCVGFGWCANQLSSSF
ncbi:hypothetical protein [Psychrobacter sp. I-STPA6b]|uniref:hypothetical protein n=1 Tax=Psychrobacter sp. I-STPA6b TaxID=2585718 RepID=UPI001D0C2344|nr:hypothetical protein [Psychrobacter sp. I-STPA6b]